MHVFLNKCMLFGRRLAWTRNSYMYAHSFTAQLICTNGITIINLQGGCLYKKWLLPDHSHIFPVSSQGLCSEMQIEDRTILRRNRSLEKHIYHNHLPLIIPSFRRVATFSFFNLFDVEGNLTV